MEQQQNHLIQRAEELLERLNRYSGARIHDAINCRAILRYDLDLVKRYGVDPKRLEIGIRKAEEFYRSLV